MKYYISDLHLFHEAALGFDRRQDLRPGAVPLSNPKLEQDEPRQHPPLWTHPQ